MESKIIKLEEDLRQAMLRNDVIKLDELIDDSLLFIAPNGIVITKQMDLEAHKSKIQKIFELNPSEQQLQINDNITIVTVKMKLVGTYLKTDISGNYRYLRIWKKINNNWKIIAGSVIQIPE